MLAVKVVEHAHFYHECPGVATVLGVSTFSAGKRDIHTPQYAALSLRQG